jgi:hypothetical protein
MGDNQGDDQRGGDGGCHHEPRAVTLLPEPAHAGGEVDFEAGHERGVMGTILLRCCLSAGPMPDAMNPPGTLRVAGNRDRMAESGSVSA